jgi:nitrogen fixation NifU-like protein
MNKSLEEALSILHEFYELIKGYPYDKDILVGDAVVYQGVSQFPARVKCATLAWKAAEQAILKTKEDTSNG